MQRELGSLSSIKVNNFFLFVALLVWGALQSGVRPSSAEPLLLLLGVLLLFPASSDPLTRIPPERLGSWPLGAAQRIGLRMVSLLLSPVLWITLFLMSRIANRTAAEVFLAFAVAVQVGIAVTTRAARRHPAMEVLRFVPGPGRYGLLFAKNLRELLVVLDTYVAVLLAAGGWFFAPDEGYPLLSLLIALAPSTVAQSLFGLEYEAAVRYRVLPLRGWQILLAKDAAYLVLVLVLTARFDPAAALTFGFVALAIGHHSSVCLYLPQRRWRFTAGRLLPVGALQPLLAMTAGFAESQLGLVVLPVALGIWAASVAVYGALWDRRMDG